MTWDWNLDQHPAEQDNSRRGISHACGNEFSIKRDLRLNLMDGILSGS
jgi:hypothetical protein